MKLVCISDTHNNHRDVVLPDGDILIHGGDFSNTGKYENVKDFISWFAEQPHTHKILIAGNHEVTLDEKYETNWRKFHHTKQDAPSIRALLSDRRINYLENQEIVINGIKFYGSPYSSQCGWNFHYENSDKAHELWSKIPRDTDVLITHTPAFSRVDSIEGQPFGCEILKKYVDQIKPRVHICGHIHEAYGTNLYNGTLAVNASVTDGRHCVVNEPIIVDLQDI